MKVIIAFAFFILFLGAGCMSNFDKNIDISRSNYVKGGVYRLNKPAFLFRTDKHNPNHTIFLVPLGFSGTPTDVASFTRSAPSHPQVVALLMPGELIRVIRFSEIRSSTLGVFLQVYAKVISGDNTDSVIELSMVSLSKRPSSKLFVDTEYLER